MHIDAFLHPCLNCLLKSRPSLYHVWRENSKDRLCPQGFQDGKYIYIHNHRILWWVLWACNLCIKFRRVFQRKNASTKFWRLSRIFPAKLLDWILFGENEEFMWIWGFLFYFFSDALKSLLLIPVTPKVHTEDKDKSNVFLNNFLKI